MKRLLQKLSCLMPKWPLSWSREDRFSFVALVSSATLFTPVVFYFGIVVFVVPVSATLGSLVLRICSGRLLSNANFGMLIYCTIYLLAFSLIAFLTVHPTLKLRWSLRLGIRLAVMALICATSFARVITYSSLGGSGGVYSFWTAIPRAWEKWPH